jgi:hypothetical protein
MAKFKVSLVEYIYYVDVEIEAKDADEAEEIALRGEIPEVIDSRLEYSVTPA